LVDSLQFTVEAVNAVLIAADSRVIKFVPPPPFVLYGL